MGKFDWIDFGGIRARFCGLTRGADDDPHYVLAVQMSSGCAYYGDYQLIFESDGEHYSVKILSFGFGSERNVGNPHPGARTAFSAADMELIQSAIERLVQADTDKPSPLHEHRERLRGVTTFGEEWIRAQ